MPLLIGVGVIGLLVVGALGLWWVRRQNAARTARPAPAGGLRGQTIAWRASGDPLVPFVADHGGLRFLVRIGDFPEEPMYTLLAERAGLQTELESFDDWPATWSRPAKQAPPVPPADLGDGTRVTYESGSEHSPGCAFGKTTLVVDGDGTVHLEMRRGGFRSAWQARITEAGRDQLFAALRAAGYPAMPAPKGTPGMLVPGQTFDVISTVDASGAKASMSMEANDLRFDKGYGPAWTVFHALMRQMTDGKVGYETPAMSALGDLAEVVQQTA